MIDDYPIWNPQTDLAMWERNAIDRVLTAWRAGEHDDHIHHTLCAPYREEVIAYLSFLRALAHGLFAGQRVVETNAYGTSMDGFYHAHRNPEPHMIYGILEDGTRVERTFYI